MQVTDITQPGSFKQFEIRLATPTGGYGEVEETITINEEYIHNRFPASKRRMYKYISICLIYLSFIQIFRIMSFAFCLKYFPNHWDIVHVYSSYLFYYPGILTLWYFYSRKQNIFA